MHSGVKILLIPQNQKIIKSLSQPCTKDKRMELRLPEKEKTGNLLC
jgi:hypothetical protein